MYPQFLQVRISPMLRIEIGHEAFIQSIVQEYAEHRPYAGDDMAQASRSDDGQRCAFPPLIVNTERGETTRS